jgi:acetyl esterase/lipase
MTTTPRLSTRSRLIWLALKLLRAQRHAQDLDHARTMVERNRTHPASYAPPRRLRKDVHVTVDHSSGWPVFTIVPATGLHEGTVVSVHGGGWVGELQPMAWRFLARLSVETGTRVIVPIYPLVPWGTADDVVTKVAELVHGLKTSGERVVLMGDSAGGQIALSAAQVLRDTFGQTVELTVLLAGAVDLSFSNPQIADLERVDPILAAAGPSYHADLWRGDLPIDDPRVSPLFGSFDGLGPLLVFCGTWDILLADVRLMVAKARDAGVVVDYHEGPRQLHVYPAFPTPEGAAARVVINTTIRKALTP